MPKFMTVLLCKMYNWHSKYTISKYIAAQKSAYSLAIMVFANLLTIWWLLAILCNVPFRSFSANFYLILVISLPLLFALTLHVYFVTNKRYLKVCNKNSEKFNFFGLSDKGFTLTYIISSWSLLGLTSLLYMTK
jgi:hypothetical protein